MALPQPVFPDIQREGRCLCQMPVTLTVPTTKIKSRIDDRRPSATPLTVHTQVVVIQGDGQHASWPTTLINQADRATAMSLPRSLVLATSCTPSLPSQMRGGCFAVRFSADGSGQGTFQPKRWPYAP